MQNIISSVMYRSIRREILDQKKCQFNMFKIVLTVNAAIIALGSKYEIPMVYIASILMNLLALRIISDKAMSIGRMTGYLQLMERIPPPSEGGWMWEYHLKLFREKKTGKKFKYRDPKPQHRYIGDIMMMLVLLSIVSVLLFCFESIYLQQKQLPNNGGFSFDWSKVDIIKLLQNPMQILGMVFTFGFIIWCIIVAINRWRKLVYKEFTSKAIVERWLEVFKDIHEENNKLEIIAKPPSIKYSQDILYFCSYYVRNITMA